MLCVGIIGGISSKGYRSDSANQAITNKSVLLADPELKPEAVALAHYYSRVNPNFQIEVKAAPVQEALEFIKSGANAVGLYYTEDLATESPASHDNKATDSRSELHSLKLLLETLKGTAQANPPASKRKELHSEALFIDYPLLITNFWSPVDALNTNIDPTIPLQFISREQFLRTNAIPEGAVASARFRDLKPQFKILAIDNLRPDLKTVLLKEPYPLAKQVSLVRLRINDSAAPEVSFIRQFVDWLKSNEAAQVFSGTEGLLTLGAVGDVMMARGVATKLKERGPKYHFELVRDLISRWDVAVANLESPIGVTGRPIPNKLIWYRAPPEAATSLASSGIDVVTVANNHIMDYDVENFVETLETLNKMKIGFFGGGLNIDEARSPLIVDKNGVRLAFLGYSAFAHIFWSWSYPRSFEATHDQPGVAPLRDEVLPDIAQDISIAKQQADVVIVAYHWGDEYVNYPNEFQVKLARKTIDLGADVVLGFHPHAIQGIELYKNGLIAYSLGNFVMDQQRPETKESIMLEITLSRDGIKNVSIIPALIEDTRPRPLYFPEDRRLMQKIKTISTGLPLQ